MPVKYRAHRPAVTCTGPQTSMCSLYSILCSVETLQINDILILPKNIIGL